ncbi:MAG: hypothetical protein HY270_09510 [Deltaproteobacteria bacterium]|nr:hypothetical protein [Deltaproteobacteria bacterium]
MVRIGLRSWGVACLVGMALLFSRSPSSAIPLDKDGDIKVGVRTYVNARIGTENTHDGVLTSTNGVTTSTSATWPKSNAGHLRQNRFFVEAELKHDLDRLVKQGVGPFALLNDLPFKVRNLGYGITFRGEADGLYDWGPKEYSTAQENLTLQRGDPALLVVSNFGQTTHIPLRERRSLRNIGTHRERLFQAYLEGNFGDLFWRFGRQILSWGETDGFRLLDNINPLDSSFGGFLISLDERRVPLDMLRTTYFIGDAGPFSEMFLEMYGAVDRQVAYVPGTQAGSPWTLPSLGAPSNDTLSYYKTPPRNFTHTRGGGKFQFNALDATFSIAHYYTYQNTEALQVLTSGSGYPDRPGDKLHPDDPTKSLLNSFNDGQPCGLGPTFTNPDYSRTNCGYPTHVIHRAPLTQISGVTTTFALPSLYSVVRSELAYFKDQAAFSQGQLDPFIFNDPVKVAPRKQTGGRRLRDSLAFVLGLDTNQWVRWLNPNQTFFISTQFFYTHIMNAGSQNIWLPATKDVNGDGHIDYLDSPGLNPKREVLPLDLDVKKYLIHGTPYRLEPIFITQPADQFLHTLFITTSYFSGQINPSMTFFYDWGGGIVYQPSLTVSRDPFRFSVDYSILDSHIYKGGSGVSLLKDRDNIQFRFEYVI